MSTAKSSRQHRAIVAIAAIMLASPLSPGATASASDTQELAATYWGFDAGGKVLAIARSGNTLYFGGTFDSVSPVSGGGAIVPPATGVPLTTSPRIGGSIYVAIDDGEGGWFVGGEFTGVAGLPRSNLAHILRTGKVSEWAPNPDGVITALERDSRALYVGGAYTRIGGKARDNLARLDCITGQVSDWNPGTSAGVFGIVLHGPLVYIGGYFADVGGQARAGLAAVRADDASVDPWNPGVLGAVFTMCAYQDTLYIGGKFRAVGGLARANLAAVDMNRTTTSWDLSAVEVPSFRYLEENVSAMVLDGPRLYVGGVFNQIAGALRNSVAALDLPTRSVNGWDPHGVQDFVPPSVTALGIHNGALYLGCSYDSLGGVPLVDPTAVLDTQTGLAITHWGARPNLIIHTFAMSGDALFIGGDFTTLGPLIARHHLAAFDATTGQPTPWDPKPDVYVQSLAAKDGRIYAGGAFTFIGGADRRGLAEIDSATGAATAWDPGCNGDVWTLSLTDTALYVGGRFSILGGVPRSWAGSFILRSHELAPWQPMPNDIVAGIATAGDGRIYLGGQFTQVGSQRRIAAAAVDAVLGSLLPWDPRPNGGLDDIVVQDTTVYMGGVFTQIGAVARQNVGAVSARTGAPTSFRADTDGLVKTIAVKDSVLYVGGLFTMINEAARSNLGAVNASTGNVFDWVENTDLIVWTLEPINGRIFVGGAFRRLGLDPASLMGAVLPFMDASEKPPENVLPNVSGVTITNPASGSAIVRYGLQRAGLVKVAVYDIAGRCVGVHSSAGVQQAGMHLVELPTVGWRSGAYIVSVTVGGETRSRKFIVLS